MLQTPPDLVVLERDRKYAWEYFQLHSSQRIATFNFYISLATALLGGMLTALQPSFHIPAIGVVLSAVSTLIAFVFWKLDERNRMLIKHSEKALKEIERAFEQVAPASLPSAGLFHDDEQEFTPLRSVSTWQFWRNQFSYSDCFELVFATFGGLGILGTIVGIIFCFTG